MYDDDDLLFGWLWFPLTGWLFQPQAITALVQESMGYIDATPDDATKERLIVTLKDICEGKIYVEGEGAKFTMMLSK